MTSDVIGALMMEPNLSKSYIDRELLKDLDPDRADIL